MTTITAHFTTDAELEEFAQAAAAAAPVWRASTAAERASWLRAAADALDASADELVEIADRETRLGTARLRGEVGRTTGQLRLFASVVEEGSYLELTIDDADASATPPRPELRRLLIPVGPVAVFSASNFPFAFSVAGGDTASALAAGCPVIVKAHSGHPELSRRTAEIVAAALEAAGAPAGSLALIEGRDAGNALVQHPVVQAAGFTGSLGGGRALFDLASGRPDPIPFYGELGSVNPVVVTPAAAAERGDELAKGLVGSFTLGVGQFCTKPGVVFIPRGAGFEAAVAAHAAGAVGGPLLTDRITAAFPEGIDRLVADPSVEIIAGSQSAKDTAAEPVVLATDASAVADRPDVLLEECFGPVTLLVRYDGADDLQRALEAVPGSLTATLHSQPGDDVADVLVRAAAQGGTRAVRRLAHGRRGHLVAAARRPMARHDVAAHVGRRDGDPPVPPAARLPGCARGAAPRGAARRIARATAAPPQRRAPDAVEPCAFRRRASAVPDGGRAHGELRVEPDRMTRRLHLARDQLHEAKSSGTAHLARRLAHRGQRHRGDGGELDVVVPHHRDVLGHPHPAAQEAVHHAAGQMVIGRHDPIRTLALGTLRDPGAHGHAAIQGRPLAPHQLEADAGMVLDRLADAFEPLAHLPDLFARAQEREPAASQ